MLKNTLNIVMIAVIASIVAFWTIYTLVPHFGQASVAVNSTYLATTTDTQASFANYRVLQGKNSIYADGRVATSVPTTLGSVIITKTGASAFCLYDATSTRTNGEAATTTVACFPGSATVGTYTFDAELKRGILVEFADSTGVARASTTITYR